MNRYASFAAALAATALIAAGSAFAAEHPIGNFIKKDGMVIGAVYLQPVHMAPMLPGMKGPYDVHLEADIHALRDNPNGFREDAWIPYLGISYSIRKDGSDWHTGGAFMPMVANDGPHYGANVKLDGPGKYRLEYHITPPPYQGFYRHTDRETGVAEWWQPFDVSWEFTYVGGAGKKGGY